MTAERQLPPPTPPAASARRHRHLLDFEDWTAEEVASLLDTADVMAQVLTRPVKKVPALQGYTVATLFFEESTRTRLSFERAARAQSADVISFAAGSSSLKKGESMRDTLRTIEQMQPDLYVVRHPSAGVPHQLTRWTDRAVVNAGDGRHAHPTQALLDAYTLRAALTEAGLPLAERTRPFAGRRLTVVGDVEHSRVARSNVELFTLLGGEVVLCAPAALLPRELGRLPNVHVTTDLDEAARDADALMALRIQRERLGPRRMASLAEYVARYQLRERHLEMAKPHAFVMHPGPMNRDVEVATELADGPRSLVERQVASGVPVRMAVLYALLVGKR